MAFATTTGAMLLGIFAAEAEQQTSAAAVGHEVQDIQGATVPHDASHVDAGGLASETSAEHAATLLPVNGDAQPQAQSSVDALIHHDADHSDSSATQIVSDPLSEASAATSESSLLTGQPDQSAYEQSSDGALPALELTDIGATETALDALTGGLQDLSAITVESLNTTLTSAGQTVVDLLHNTTDGATAALHNPIGSTLDPALGSISSTLGDVSGTLGHALGSLSETTPVGLPAVLTATTAIEPATA